MTSSFVDPATVEILERLKKWNESFIPIAEFTDSEPGSNTIGLFQLPPGNGGGYFMCEKDSSGVYLPHTRIGIPQFVVEYFLQRGGET